MGSELYVGSEVAHVMAHIDSTGNYLGDRPLDTSVREVLDLANSGGKTHPQHERRHHVGLGPGLHNKRGE